MKKLLILTLAILAMVFCFTACGDNVTVNAITVTAGSIKTEYEVGETPDFTGIEAVITYSDGTAKTVKHGDLVVGTVDTSTAGEKKLTVKYGDISCEITITVKEKEAEATLSSIKIVEGTVATEVYVGTALDLSGIQVEATYSDGTVKVLKAEDLQISAPDTSTVGDKTLTVKYGDATDTLTVKVSGIAALTVVAGTVAGKVFVGEALDTTGLQVLVAYDNGKSEVVEAAALTIGTVDTSEAGEKKLEISYKGVKAEYTVTVVGEKALTVTPGSVAAFVKVKGALDVSKVAATLEYTDGTKKSLTAADLSVQNVDTSTAGEKTLKVTYGSLEAGYTVTVVGVKKLTVISGSVKNEVLVGEEFSTGNIRVLVEYTNAAIAGETLNKSALTLGGISTATAGDKQLSITYLDKTENYTVKVCGVTSIRIEGVNKVLPAGEELDISEMKVYGVYNDSKATEVLLAEGITTNYSSLDFNSEEDKDFVVSYAGRYGSFSATVKISATAPALERIEVSVWDKYVILKGSYDKTVVKAIAYYANETEETITNDKLVIGDVVTDEAGTVKLTVSYTEGDVTKSAEADVEVLPITSVTVNGIEKLVNKGEALDTSGVSLLVTFSKGEFSVNRTVTAEDGVTVSTPDTSEGGDKKLTVTYLDFEVEFEYHVKAVKEISIFAGISDVIMQGYQIDTSALVIEITYTNNDKEHKKASEVGATVAVEGTKVTVSYQGFSAEKTVKSVKIVSVNALNGTVPTSVLLNGTINYSAFKLTVICEDGSVYLIGADDPNLEIQRIDTSTPGTKAIVFKYMNKDEFTASVNVVVNGVVGLELVEGSLLTTLNVGQVLETAGLKLKVTYSDGTYTYIDTTYNLTIGSVDSSTAGDKTLKITYQGFEIDIVIKVTEVTANGLIFGALLPDSIVARETYKKNFKDATQAYVVGDDNPYYFYLNVLMLDDNDDIVDVDGKNIPSTVKVYDVTGGGKTLLEGDALTAMVAVNANTNAYDFTEAAIGRSFELVIHPKEKFVDVDAVTKSHTVTVVDGYNIYDAKELNIITNTDDDLDGGNIEGHLGQLTAVDKFLAANNITRPSKLAGIVLHGNVDVKETDIPAEYLYHYTKGGVAKRGFYDHLSVYNRLLDNTNPSFTIHGNYYSIYTYNLSCITEKGFANNDDEFSSSEIFRFRPKKGDSSVYNATYDHTKYTANVQNTAFRDNDPNSNDQSASERHMRGLMCFKITEVTANITNTNVDAYVISMCVENDYTTVNLNKVKFYNAWQGHLFLWNHNGLNEHLFDTDEAPLAGHVNMKININQSLLAKCGGPVILSQNSNPEYTRNSKSCADIVVDEASELYSYVTGQEAWFVAVGQTAMAGQILAMNALVNGTAQAMGKTASYTANDKIQGVNTVNMVMVNMGTGTTFTSDEDYDGTFKKGDVVGLNMTDNEKLDQYTGFFDYLVSVGAAPAAPPVFQSSAGGTAYTDGATGCYAVDFTNNSTTNSPDATFFQGDYLTLYYLGMGIMLEYYH